MKQNVLAAIGVAVTLALMAVLAYTVFLYTKDPENSMYMMGMGALSSAMMLFLVIFGLVYTRAGNSASDTYMEMYRGVCSRCGLMFSEDGVCPGCGRRRPDRRG